MLKSLNDRTTEHLRDLGFASSDVDGLMRHILDSLGALRHMVKKNHSVSVHLRRVFRSAAVSMLDRIVCDYHYEDGTAVDNLIEVFPDSKKKIDGRGWLPLHWASAVDTFEEDFDYIAKGRPVAAKSPHILLESRDIIPIPKGGAANDCDPPCDGLLPLHFMSSLKYPKFSSLKHLMKMYPNALITPDKRGWLPLHWCAFNCQDEKVMNYIIDKYADATYSTTLKGQLPFQLTTHNTSTDIAMLVLERNNDALRCIDSSGNNVLHDAVFYWNSESTMRMMELCPELAFDRNYRGQYPIHRVFSVVHHDDAEKALMQIQTVQALMQADIRVAQLKDSEGHLPLHLTVKYNASFELIEYVYSCFPSAALIKDNVGKAPMDYAHMIFEQLEHEESTSGSTAASTTTTARRDSKSLLDRIMFGNNKIVPTSDVIVGVPSSNNSVGSGNPTDEYSDDECHGEVVSRPALTGETLLASLSTHEANELKYSRIKTLLLGCAPALAKAGGTSSFAKFTM